MNNLRARFVVFLLGDPHLLKGGERGQYGSTNPDRVFALRRSNNLDFDGGRSKSLDFSLHTLGNTIKHGGTTRQDDVAVKILNHGTMIKCVEGNRFTREEKRWNKSDL